jgi:hypothetical protein
MACNLLELLNAEKELTRSSDELASYHQITTFQKDCRLPSLFF